MKFILQAIAQIIPNKAGIEAVSSLERPVEVSKDAMDNIAQTAKRSMVSFEDDKVSNAKDTTTYDLSTAVYDEDGNIDIWPTRYVITGKKISK